MHFYQRAILKKFSIDTPVIKMQYYKLTGETPELSLFSSLSKIQHLCPPSFPVLWLSTVPGFFLISTIFIVFCLHPLSTQRNRNAEFLKCLSFSFWLCPRCYSNPITAVRNAACFPGRAPAILGGKRKCRGTSPFLVMD